MSAGERVEAARIAAACRRIEPTFRVINMVLRGAEQPTPCDDKVVWTITYRRSGRVYEQTIDITDEDGDPDVYAKHKLMALSTCLLVLKKEAKS